HRLRPALPRSAPTFPASTTDTGAESGRLQSEWPAEKHSFVRLRAFLLRIPAGRGRRALHGIRAARSRRPCWDPRSPSRSGVVPATAALVARAGRPAQASAEVDPIS